VPLGGTGAFSFNPGKNIGALGDAGAIVTDDPAIATKARLLRDHGRASKNEHTLIGFNSRLGCLDDAVLALKLDYLDRWNERRRAHAARYDALFASSAISPVRTERGVVPARHQYVVRVGNRDDVRARLADAGIDTMIHYPRLIVEQPPLRMLGWSAADVPMAAAVNEAMISIPCYPELEPQQADFVAATLLACAVEANEEGAA
jgi:dTDP-4-amino-4,6-dideoxygalactose transaminase